MSSKFNSVRIILRQFVPSLYFPREEESFDDLWIRSNRKKEKNRTTLFNAYENTIFLWNFFHKNK